MVLRREEEVQRIEVLTPRRTKVASRVEEELPDLEEELQNLEEEVQNLEEGLQRLTLCGLFEVLLAFLSLFNRSLEVLELVLKPLGRFYEVMGLFWAHLNLFRHVATGQ